jgi:hypothetical protein
MLGPLGKTVKVESVSTNSCTRGDRITFYYLHVAYRTQIILLLILVLLDYYVSFGNLHFDVLEEVRNFIFVDASVGNDVPQLLVIVVLLKK